jgi:hypothetical protein
LDASELSLPFVAAPGPGHLVNDFPEVKRYVKQRGEVMPLKEHAGLVAEFVQTSNIQLFL